jgi:hypothetical protein
MSPVAIPDDYFFDANFVYSLEADGSVTVTHLLHGQWLKDQGNYWNREGAFIPGRSGEHTLPQQVDAFALKYLLPPLRRAFQDFAPAWASVALGLDGQRWPQYRRSAVVDLRVGIHTKGRIELSGAVCRIKAGGSEVAGTYRGELPNFSPAEISFLGPLDKRVAAFEPAAQDLFDRLELSLGQIARG